MYFCFAQRFLCCLLLLVFFTPVTKAQHAGALLDALGITKERASLDTSDSKLTTLFKAHTHDVYKLYEAFIEWDDNRTSQQATHKAKQILRQLEKTYDRHFLTLHSTKNIEEAFFFWMRYCVLRNAAAEEITRCFPKDSQKGYGLPLWLVLKHPQILHDEPWPRYPADVCATQKVFDLPHFSQLRRHLEHLTEGRWVTTSYVTHQGTIRLDINGNHRLFERLLNFHPAAILKEHQSSTTEELLRPLKMWASEGLWNNLAHKDFVVAFTNATKELQTFYKSQPHLKAYHHKVHKLLAAYIYLWVPVQKKAPAFYLIDMGEEKFCKAMAHKALKFCTQQTLNACLSRGILNGFSAKTLEVIIQFGADVNALHCSETPLMKAVQRPEVVALLLKHGAKVNARNPFGKTALFYAIQFGSDQTIQMLLQAGANANDALYNLKRMEHLSDKSYGDFMLEHVADFTPLVYAMRYGSCNTQKLLKQRGATLGCAPPKRINAWVINATDAHKP